MHLKQALSCLRLPVIRVTSPGSQSSTVESSRIRSSRSTPNLNDKKVKRSTSKGRINYTLRWDAPHGIICCTSWVDASFSLLSNRQDRTQSTESISSRNPDLPVQSLPGPPVPPRSVSHIGLHKMSCGDQPSESMKLRRSTSETKIEKNKRNEERASKARSVHFDGASATANAGMKNA